MFTLFHTADWHLGQSFHNYDRHEEHAAFLKWLRQQLQDHQPDALIIAGDIFDTINPSAKATKLYYEFLAHVRAELPQLHLVITAGNHDSGSRLEAPADLLSALHISVIGTVQKDEAGNIDLNRLLVPLSTPSGQLQAVVIAMPFLRPSDVPRLPEAKDAYIEGIADLYQQAYAAAEKYRAKADVPIIAIGHCHVQGGKESTDSERRITIGGAEALSTTAFPPNAAYVALGHLHKAQKFESKRICYSGSPIPLSFSERSYEHRILKASFDQASLKEVQDLLIPTSVPLLTIPPKPASLNDVLLQLEELPICPNARPLESGNTSATKASKKKQKANKPNTKADEFKTDATLTHSSPATDVGPAAFLEVRILNDGPDPTRCRQIEDALQDKHVRLASIKLASPPRSDSEEPDDAVLSLDQLQTLNPEDIFISAYKEKYADTPENDVLDAFRTIMTELETNQ
ncbi:MAG: exonuclease subunit SbcD [Fuerstiella sp.]